MPTNLTYLLIDLGAFIVPFLFSFHPRIKFYKEWYAFWRGNLITTILFLIWDICFTKAGIWGFNRHYVTGFYLFSLPVEEILFFFCIPYASVFTYHCFELFFLRVRNYSFGLVSVIIVSGLIVIGFLNVSKLYTTITFLLLALVIIDLAFIRKVKWLSHFYLMYTVILLPFFIVNGLLTGTGINEPVVWYNNSENLSIRVLTIPVEDFFYGMLLLLLNVSAFDAFKKRKNEEKDIDLSI